MNTKLILVVTFILLASIGFAQTKKIAFKSHSGNMANYACAVSQNLFDIENSNFGVAPTREIIEAKLDSVIFICDTAVIMVTSSYCTKKNWRSTIQEKTKLWKAGRETVYYHPLFSKKHSLDSIKNILKTQYYFKNPIDGVKFIGYDNTKDSCKNDGYISKSVNLPTSTPNNIDNGFTSKQLPITILGIFLFSVLVGVLAKFGNSKSYKLSYA
jgi:hypothetical protein